jgi:hypothetical protein
MLLLSFVRPRSQRESQFPLARPPEKGGFGRTNAMKKKSNRGNLAPVHVVTYSSIHGRRVKFMGGGGAKSTFIAVLLINVLEIRRKAGGGPLPES